MVAQLITTAKWLEILHMLYPAELCLYSTGMHNPFCWIRKPKGWVPPTNPFLLVWGTNSYLVTKAEWRPRDCCLLNCGKAAGTILWCKHLRRHLLRASIQESCRGKLRCPKMAEFSSFWKSMFRSSQSPATYGMILSQSLCLGLAFLTGEILWYHEEAESCVQCFRLREEDNNNNNKW